ncbi:hypothetical protein BD310DRAFT_729978 [Dichomitus squalens]|uniref:Uncharacterized protein n=1 Tax=Dichomitus squalens TaxID=114155 RepID=A0A4Q9PKP2_9APHY|nr:hypothetical protein BD310DRAFT_729978 [Dichomitus squalens]
MISMYTLPMAGMCLCSSVVVSIPNKYSLSFSTHQPLLGMSHNPALPCIAMKLKVDILPAITRGMVC